MNLEPLSDGQLEAIARAVGDTSEGLTGSEIGRLLRQCGIADPFPSSTKWRRLLAALEQRQARDRSGNNGVAFLLKASNQLDGRVTLNACSDCALA